MRQLRILILLLIPIPYSFGQSVDTVYLDSNWKETLKEKSVYYRVISEKSNGLYNCKDYWITGELQMDGNFSSLYPQTRQGEFKWYYKNGVIQQVINYIDNNSTGLIRTYDSNGNIDLEYIYKIDSLDNSMKFKSRINDFRYHVGNNLRYPENARKAFIEGTVMTKFYINKQGEIDRFEITESVNDLLDKEAERVIRSFKKWPIPKYKGENTFIELTFPVVFYLQ